MPGKMTNKETFEAMYAAWGAQKTEEVESYVHHEKLTFESFTSTVAPLNKLYREYPDGIQGWREWNQAFASYQKPFSMDIVMLTESGNDVYAHFKTDFMYFDTVRYAMDIINVFTFENGKIVKVTSIGDITGLERMFQDQNAQKAATVSVFEDLAAKFQAQDVPGIIAMLHPECELKVPIATKAPWNQLYREYPLGGQGFIQWMTNFGATYTDITCLEPIRHTAVNPTTTLSVWKFQGCQFGAYHEEFMSTWKHTIVDGKVTKIECLDDLTEIMAITTPEQNMASFTACFQAWAQEDIEGCMAGFHEDVVFTCPVSTVEPVNKLYKKYPNGHAGVLEWIANLAEHTNIKDIQLKDLSAVKDTLFASFVINEEFCGKTVPEYTSQWVCKIKEGKMISVRELNDASIFEKLFA